MAAKAISSGLKQVWNALAALNVPVALMGGLALAVWQHVRSTRDIDFLVAIGGMSPEELVRHLASAGLRPKRKPLTTTLGPLRIVQLVCDVRDSLIEIQVDLLLAESEYHLEALSRRRTAQLPEIDEPVFVLSCEDLVLHKLMAGRMIDRADAVALLRANIDVLDLGYCRQWISKLKISDDADRVWQEALPDTTPWQAVP
jgi:hypothetical protein